MAWIRPTAELMERFGKALPDDDRVERRTMFGCPCAFVGGHMFAGLHGQGIFVRLPEARRTTLLASGRAAPFAPLPGRVMREYVVVPDPTRRLSAWIAEALRHAATLPPKPRRGARRPDRR